jgi:hypothetical protein
MGEMETEEVNRLLPGSLKVEYLSGDSAFQAQQVAALSGIHPIILEMGRTLVNEPGKVARFKLANEQLRQNAEPLRTEFINGLRRIGKALSPAQALLAKGGLDGDSLVFWYEKSWSRAKKKSGDAG